MTRRTIMSGSFASSEESQKTFAIKHFFVKSQQFKLREPLERAESNSDERVEYEQEMRLSANKRSETLYEVVLELNITGRLGNQQLFTTELQQCGLFELKNLTESEQQQVLNIQAPHMLYPYASKVITQMSVDAGLAPVYLVPIDFAGLHQQKMSQQKTNGADNAVISSANVEQTDPVASTYDLGGDVIAH